MNKPMKQVSSKIKAMAERLGASRVDVTDGDFHHVTFTTTLPRVFILDMHVAIPLRMFSAAELVAPFGSSEAASLLDRPFALIFQPRLPWPMRQQVYRGADLAQALESWEGMGQVLFLLPGTRSMASGTASGLTGVVKLGADIPLALAIALEDAEHRGIRMRSIRLLDLSPFSRRGVLVGAQGSEKAMWALHAAYAAVMPVAAEGELPTPIQWLEFGELRAGRPDSLMFQLPLRG